MKYEEGTGESLFSPMARRRALVRCEVSGRDDFLRRRAASLMRERLADVRVRFASVLLHAHPAVESLPSWSECCVDRRHLLLGFDEDLSLTPASYDLVYSVLELHWANDLAALLLRLRYALCEGGLLHGCLLGGESLGVLRHCLSLAESEISGGVWPRVIPFVAMESLVSLLRHVGFTDAVVDREVFSVSYGDLFALMRALRCAGEGNFLRARVRRFTRRAVLARAAEIYARDFAHGDGIEARFELLFLHAWR